MNASEPKKRKLTKPQQRVLAHLSDGTTRLAYGNITGRCWVAHEQGFAIKVSHATFNSLSLAGLIAPTRSSLPAVRCYLITEAGRNALPVESESA